jgi:MSHA pilin protein MshC
MPGGMPVNSTRRQRGFTLIELITIMVIMGILGALAAPRFFDRNVFDSRGFADQVLASLRYAQKEAIAQRRFVCAAFTANSVTLTYDPTAPSAAHTAATCPGNALSSPSGETSYLVSSNQAKFTIVTPSNLDFNFDALGRASAARTISVTDVTGVTNPISISVEAETGYVH